MSAVPNLNLVVYLTTSNITRDKKVYHTAGIHGYYFSDEKEGKKKLAKNVPTANGYYTNNPHLPNEVVNIESYLSGHCLGSENSMDILNTVVEKLITEANNNQLKSIYLITDSAPVYAFLTKPVRDFQQNMKFGKEEIVVEQLERFKALREQLQELEKNTKFTVDVNGSVEGGAGNRMVTKQIKLANAFSSMGDVKKLLNVFRNISKKEFEAPDIDFNKIVEGNRWYFNTGGDSKFYDLFEGMRVYTFGTVETDKKYYGKLTPDVTFSKLYTKQKIELFDKMFDYTRENIENKEGYLIAGNVALLKSKDLSHLIDSMPGIPQGNQLVMPYRVSSTDEPVLIEKIDPPMMSYIVKERLDLLDNAFTAFLTRESNPKAHLEYLDITDRIYVKEENGKGVVKVKVLPDLKQDTLDIKVDVNHPNAKRPIPVSVAFGYDLPSRNNLNGATDHPDIKVWLVVDKQMGKGFVFYSIIETSEWCYILTNAVGNVRVIPLKDLKD